MIFRKTKKPGDSEPVRMEQQTPPPQRQEVPEPQQEATATGPSVLTPDAVLEGNLSTEGELHIDGTVHGSVQASVIVIGAQGAVHGHVVGEEVYIRGRVIGPICGVNVTIVAGGHVEGDILNQTIAIETGAYIDGKIRRTEDPIGEWQRMWYGEDYEGAYETQAAEPLTEGDAYAPLDLGMTTGMTGDAGMGPGFGSEPSAGTPAGFADPLQGIAGETATDTTAEPTASSPADSGAESRPENPEDKDKGK